MGDLSPPIIELEPTVQVLAKNNFGTIMFYPHNKQAQRFTELLKTETLTRTHLSQINEMGFTIEEIAVRYL